MFPQQQQQQQGLFCDQSAGSINHNTNYYGSSYHLQEESGEAQYTGKRRECTNFYFDQLYTGTLVLRPGEKHPIRNGGRKNKNEILGLTLARILKDKYLKGNIHSLNIGLACGISMNLHNGEFVLVLRTDGRVIAMSDEAEDHLGKSMRSLYSQFINIYECLDETDGSKLGRILNSSINPAHNEEHRLVCTFRLPKGKRPSRANEDVKAISITGHFYYCDSDSSTPEKLFIARCEALVSRTKKRSNVTQTTTMTPSDNSKSVMTITLNGDMTINSVSANVTEQLGFARHEMIGNWLGRFLPTDDLEKFEKIQQKFFQHGEHQQKLSPMNVCEVLDMYTNHGDGRLTFLCQIRLQRQRRSKLVEFRIVAQPIDPSLRNEYVKHIQSEAPMISTATDVQQVNLACTPIQEASKDAIVAYSPTFLLESLIFDNTNINDTYHQQQCSPIGGELSNGVAPVDVDDEFWEQLWNVGCTQYPANSFNNNFNACQSTFELENILDVPYMIAYENMLDGVST